uniref:Uncharacterized protein n=1 Tax=uncultured prokaryote TaxID=198431 RepID=A0A0H5QNN1_9ZZZZ|nr:hypothetical protein [uncultured prokaryote]
MADLTRIRTILTGTAVTGGGLNDMYFAGTGATEAALARDAVRTFWALWGSNSGSWQAGWDTEQALIDSATGNIDGYVTVPFAATVTAVASAASVLPVVSQGLMRWTTAGVRNGRKVRGRSFLPGITGIANASGKPTGTVLGNMNTGATNLITAADMVIYSRPSGPGLSDGEFNVVTGGTMWGEWAELRSRRD